MASVTGPTESTHRRTRALFLLALLLFALWVGFLGLLALDTAKPIILSRPQFLVSTLDVIAEVVATNGQAQPRVKLREVYWPSAQAELAGQEIEVANLSSAVGWNGAGTYILPLTRQEGVYLVAAVPRSPGFVGLPPRIYPLTEETKAQLQAIEKPPGAK